MAKQSLLIIDAFSVAYRAFYAVPPNLTAPDGTQINAVFGFVNIILRAYEQVNPTHVCICFDRKEPTFRHEVYPEYKGHRPPPPEEFIQQVPLIKGLAKDMNMVMIDKAGFEADDLMGTLATMAAKEKVHSYLVTGDQDAFQLVNPLVSVMMNKKGQADLVEMTADKVIEKMKVRPDQVIEYKALKGDSSDNIPGVPGVGDKTATTLLTDHVTLDGIYENIDQIKSKKLQEKLTLNKEIAYLSKDLATIKCDIPLDFGIEQLNFNPDWAMITAAFQAYNFKSLVSKYSRKINEEQGLPIASTDSQLATPDGRYTQINNEAQLTEIISALEKGFAIDLETTSLDVQSADIVGVALSFEDKVGYYIPFNKFLDKVSTEATLSLFAQDELATSPTAKMNPFLDLLKPLLENPSIPKFTHNGKYEINVLRRYGITLRGISFDTMLAAHLLFPFQKVGLKALVETHFNIQMTTYEAVAGKGKTKIPFQEVPVEEAVNYAAADADFTFRLTNLFTPLLIEKHLDPLLNNIELPSQDCLAQMEWDGVSLDVDYLKTLKKEFQAKSDTLRKEILNLAGEDFNLNSPKQISEILFTKMGLPVIKKTKTGISTDSSVLEKLKKDFPIAEKLLAYRSVEKLLSTYVNALPELVNPQTHKIHTSFNQTIAVTGRLSSTQPNLQNIPIRSEDGMRIRQAFIPSFAGGAILSVDYSQIELRVMAHLSEDEAMIRAFNAGEDIHQATASLIYHVPLAEVTKDQRYAAKAVNFGISYGQSAFGLAETIGVSRKEAAEIINTYYDKFPKLKTFIDESINFAEEKGYVSTMYGRQRPVPELKDPRQRQFGKRLTVNTRVQGSAAEIMKIGMINVHKAMQEKKLKSNMVIQVHDELVFDVQAEEKVALENLVRQEMESAVTLTVPLKVDAEFGESWAL